MSWKFLVLSNTHKKSNIIKMEEMCAAVWWVSEGLTINYDSWRGGYCEHKLHIVNVKQSSFWPVAAYCRILPHIALSTESVIAKTQCCNWTWWLVLFSMIFVYIGYFKCKINVAFKPVRLTGLINKLRNEQMIKFFEF